MLEMCRRLKHRQRQDDAHDLPEIEFTAEIDALCGDRSEEEGWEHERHLAT